MKVVSKSPLKVQFSGSHSKFSLSQPEPDQLRLLPNLGDRVLAWFLCVLGWPLLILALLALLALLSGRTFGRFDQFEQVMGIFVLLVFGVPLSVGGVVLLGRRFRFDHRTGEMTIRHFWRTRRRPLADIVAVQMINGGTFGSSAVRVISYQLNLVLDDPSEPRLFVAYNCDQADMGKKAKLLADFLRVPLWVEIQFGEPGYSDSTPRWATTDEPLPPFDLAAGALGGLTLGDILVQAEFLGRPDQQTEEFGRVYLDYAGRGFKLVFERGRFVELYCTIALHSADASPKPGQGFSRPRLSGGIELTPKTSLTQVQQYFGPPECEDNDISHKALTYRQGRFYMKFEFEQATERLLDWSVEALDD